MDKLKAIIGLAPSEMSWQEFKDKLVVERERVRKSLSEFRARPRGRKKRPPALSTLMKEAGLTPQQMLKGIELLRKQQEEGK